MNINIRTFFAVISIFFFLLSTSLIYNIYKLNYESNKLKDIEYNRHLMILKADELRQSSDDLSKFANKYVITSNSIYKDNYFKILDIRNGKAKRPLNYDGIYWDYLQSHREKYHPLKKKLSLKEEMSLLPYTPFEFHLLEKSKKNSDDLVALEDEAFYAMIGLFKDNNNTFTTKGKPNQQLAIHLLNSSEYEIAKEKIMSPIDKFLMSIKKRTDKSIEIQNEKIATLFKYINISLMLGVLLFIIVLILVYKKILNPISWLTDTLLHFQKSNKDVKEIIFYEDEIGLMIKQFFAMKKKMDDDYQYIKELSLVDPLTNIYNRRYFFEVSEQLFKLSHRRKEIFSLMILDIDYFKKVNDTYGHLVGDDILKFLVVNVQKNLRESDNFARFGGEEFIIILPNTDKKNALNVAEKIRRTVKEAPYINDKISFHITISIGVTEVTPKDTEIKHLIKRADEALYIAKDCGRNRVEFS